MIVHVVEDSDHLRGSLTRLLTSAGYMVRPWSDADSALAALVASRVGVVEVVMADGLRTREGRDLLDAVMAAGAAAAAVRFGSGAEGPEHVLEVVRLLRVNDSDEILRAVARAANVAQRISESLVSAGLLDVEHVAPAA